MEAHSQYTDLLKAEIDGLMGDDPRNPYSNARLAMLADLTDDQVRDLNELVYNEGIARHFGSYWQD